MGKNIGRLGQQRADLDLEFDYFDQVVRVHPHATDAVEIEFLEAAKDIDLAEMENLDLAAIEAMPEDDRMRLLRSMSHAAQAGHRALMTSLRRLIHPDDFDTYWKVGNEHGQQLRDRMADIRAITAAVVEATTDFPTRQPSASPPGRTPAPPSSVAGSPSPGTHPTDLTVSLALERGRPDIQEFYLLEHERLEQETREVREREERDRRKLTEAGLLN
jgi:hypothetical protein